MDKTNTKSQVNIIKRIISVIMNVLLGIVIITGLMISVISLSAKAHNGIPEIFGTSPLIVLSDSMEGTFSEGDLIFVKKVTFNSQGLSTIPFVENETIAAFKYDIDGDGITEIVTHLFIEKTEQNSFVFQGTYRGEDGQANLDTQVVSSSNIIGVYDGTRVKGLGSVLKFLQSSIGFLVCIVLPIFIYFLYTGIKLILVLFEDKSIKQLESTKSAMINEELEKERERIREEVRRELLEEEKKKK